MQSKISLRRLSLLVIVVGAALSLALLVNLVPQSLNPPVSRPAQQSVPAVNIENASTSPKQEQASSGLPIRLKIPKLAVDAGFEYVGLAPDGAMDKPKSLDAAAWFELGTRPGETGSAVIAGHYGYRNGKLAVFDKLYKLRKGDKLYVEDDRGVITTFVVRESRRYDPNADASDVFGSNDGGAHLNLVTCAGVWNEASQTFSQRLVVFTDKE